MIVLNSSQQALNQLSRHLRAVRSPAYQGNFAGLERITLENIIFKATASKIDFSYLTIAMDCTSVSDGLQYERSFLLSDSQVRPFNIRRTRAGKKVANKNFNGTSTVGPRDGIVDISMGFSGRTWTVNIQVYAVGRDEDSQNIYERCEGNTIFQATKSLSNL